MSDALVSNLRGDQPEKLRIRFADLEHVNPRLVCVSLSGFGTTGPRASGGRLRLHVQGLAGWMALTGGPEQPPTKSGLSLVDFCGGYVAALATAGRRLAGAARRARLRRRPLPLRDGAGAAHVHRRLGRVARLRAAPDGRLGAPDDGAVPGVPDGGRLDHGRVPEAAPVGAILRRDRPAGAGRATRASPTSPRATGTATCSCPLLADVLRSGRTAEWLEQLGAHGVPCGPVNDVAAALADPQAEARGDVVAYEHPVLGEVRGPASPFRLDGATPPAARGPMLGEHTREVLRDLCGYDDERLAELAAAGVFGTERREEER